MQWDNTPEYTGGEPGSRGHIDGDNLEAALNATAKQEPRSYTVDKKGTAVKDYQFSVEATRRRTGIKEGTRVPKPPVPEFLYIFKFQ